MLTLQVSGSAIGSSGGAGAVGRLRLAIKLDCPLCGQAPAEPVRVDGQVVCRSCAAACSVCGCMCFPGDEVCGECVRHLAGSCEVVLA